MSELEQPLLFDDLPLERQRRREAHFARLDAKGVLHASGWTTDAVGPGWAKLVEPLLHVCRLAGVEVHQIKEKFGTLRFYVGEAPEWVHTLIDLADAASGDTCEECGAHKNYGWYKSSEEIERGQSVRMRDTGWMKTLCDPCAAKREEKDE